MTTFWTYSRVDTDEPRVDPKNVIPSRLFETQLAASAAVLEEITEFVVEMCGDDDFEMLVGDVEWTERSHFGRTIFSIHHVESECQFLVYELTVEAGPNRTGD